MRKIPLLAKGGVVTGAAIAAALTLAISPASAAPTFTVSGSTGSGGAFTASASKPTLKDTTTGTTLTCASSAATGTAPNATSVSGTGIAKINTTTFATCTGPAGITFTVTALSQPWLLNAVSYASGVTTGTLTGVRASISGLCNATFADSSGVNNGATLNGSYNNSTHTLSISGGTLKAYSVSGLCLGLINNGDAANFTAAYVVTPSTLSITSP
ncbi:hypothetical protein SAMN05216223_101384 [Actinacidiphila yanglinensis]|uniref:Ig-like domain-containing protein n=1 Tax=Actinacidiphila yanglinensis TaxID=310779 RepID=A0A1H5T5V6_9ACTN|nr:hypothetical protein [Actinacidiphila yanglinensis]SEF57548.1 hypothetical protein SAMN05216223_101384 [Actinacidiphila yanglinensis]